MNMEYERDTSGIRGYRYVTGVYLNLRLRDREVGRLWKRVSWLGMFYLVTCR